MNKNMILAVVLSVVVLYVWGEFFAPKPQPVTGESQGVAGESATPAPQAGTIAPTPVPTADPSAPVAAVAGLAASHPEERGTLSGDTLLLHYTSRGGKITALAVTEDKFREKELDLLAALAPENGFPEFSSPFSVEPDYAPGEVTARSVSFVYEQAGVSETKTITLVGDYLLKIEKKIANDTTAPILWQPALHYRSIHENKEVFSSYGKRFEFLAKSAGEGMKEPSSGEKLKEAVEGKDLQWVGINYGFFLYAVLRDGHDPLTVEGSIDDKKNLTMLSTGYAPRRIEPGTTTTASFTVFLGPKEGRLLQQAGHELDASVSLGWLAFLARPLLWILNFFYGFVANYGIAIILLTILVKLILWPLSDASYKSMSKMKKLMPKVEELKKKYKEDKETLNKETMLLYQKEGVNPLGGCLPILIQMPIYIALYSMLNNAVELYNARFLPFWLTDLSEKDPYYILPVALGGFMFLQQKMTPTQMDNQQAKIMLYVMPVMFAGFMLFLPSGLNLYILANTLLGILQQTLVNKRYG